MNWKEYTRKWSRLNCRYYSGICQKDRKKYVKKLCQDSQSLSPDLNLEPRKYKANMLNHSVTTFNVIYGKWLILLHNIVNSLYVKKSGWHKILQTTCTLQMTQVTKHTYVNIIFSILQMQQSHKRYAAQLCLYVLHFLVTVINSSWLYLYWLRCNLTLNFSHMHGINEQLKKHDHNSLFIMWLQEDVTMSPACMKSMSTQCSP